MSEVFLKKIIIIKLNPHVKIYTYSKTGKQQNCRWQQTTIRTVGTQTNKSKNISNSVRIFTCAVRDLKKRTGLFNFKVWCNMNNNNDNNN